MMFHAVYEFINSGEKLVKTLNDEAEDKISTRGYLTNSKVPSDLNKEEWFLPINSIAYDYCPTNRYLYYTKIEKKRPKLTWQSYKGSVIDELLPKIYHNAKKYINEVNINDINIPNGLISESFELTNEYIDAIDEREFMTVPSESQKAHFKNYLSYIIKYEGLIASAILAHRIVNNFRINLSADYDILFPFVFKLKINGYGLGIYPEAEIDFILNQNLLGEIKSDQWHEFYKVGLAAYALAYEFERNQNINLGFIICPTYERRRKLPIYNNTAKLVVIEESWRKAFITKRNIRLQIMKNGEELPIPENDDVCKTCGFYEECWE